MEVQAKLQIGDNSSQIYSKQYNVVNLTCHYTRLTSSSRPNTDALCEHIALTLVAPNMEDLVWCWIFQTVRRVRMEKT